jgi:hypothetical protein
MRTSDVDSRDPVERANDLVSTPLDGVSIAAPATTDGE